MYIHNEQLLALFANDEHRVPLYPLDMLYHLIYDVLHFSYEREERIYRIFNGTSGKHLTIESGTVVFVTVTQVIYQPSPAKDSDEGQNPHIQLELELEVPSGFTGKSRFELSPGPSESR